MSEHIVHEFGECLFKSANRVTYPTQTRGEFLCDVRYDLRASKKKLAQFYCITLLSCDDTSQTRQNPIEQPCIRKILAPSNIGRRNTFNFLVL